MTWWRGSTVAVAGALALSSPARADDTSHVCTEAHLQAQRLRKQAKLRAARQELLTCAGEHCPAIAREDCGHWLEQLEEEVPTVVISATEASGQDLSAVRVTVDGELRVERLDGRPIELDPGEHLIRCEAGGAEPIEQRVFVTLGEKNHLLRLSFRPLPSPARSTQAASEGTSDVAPRKAPPLGAFIAFGVGAAALAAFAGFGIAGRSRESDLADRCAPSCVASDRDAVLRDYRVADVSLALGVLAVGVGAWLFFAQ